METPVNSFKQALLSRRVQIGLWLALANSYSAELLANTGFDWLLIDGEHAPNDVRSVLTQLQAIDSAASLRSNPSQAVVRLPVGDPTLIKQYLDIGAQTLLIPMVDTAEQAVRLVAATRYPPDGIRGMGSGISRVSRWQTYPAYVRDASTQVCLLVQAETPTAMDNIEAIAAINGIDGIFIGPADLAATMGHPGNSAHSDVVNATEAGIRRIVAAGKSPGILATTLSQANHWIGLGAQFVAVGVDTTLLANAARSLSASFTGNESAAKK